MHQPTHRPNHFPNHPPTRLAACAFALLTLFACGGGGTTPPPAPPPAGPTLSGTFTLGIKPGAGLYGAVNGPDGRLWLTEFQGSNLAAVITTSGSVTEFPTGAGTQPNGIAVGPDTNLWTGGYGPSIEKVTTAGVVTTYAVVGAHVGDIISGPGGKLWFTDSGNSKVGAITTAGLVTEYALPVGAIPMGIALGSDGNLWVTDTGNNAIVKISPAGAVLASYPSTISTGSPWYIVAAPDNNLYFTVSAFSASTNDVIGRVTTSGTVTKVGSLAPQSYPNRIIVGKDSNLYFTEVNTANLGKVTIAAGTVSESSPGLAANGNSAIVAGSDGRLWIGGKQTIWALTY